MIENDHRRSVTVAAKLIFVLLVTLGLTAGLGAGSTADAAVVETPVRQGATTAHQRAVGTTERAARSGQSWHFDTKPLGGFSYSVGGLTIRVPTGCFLSVSVRYDESTAAIADAKAGTDCVGPMAMNPFWYCNTRATFSWYDNRNVRYKVHKTRVDTSCKTFLLWRMPYSMRGRYGKLVVRFYVDGRRRASNTMSIHS